MTIFESTEPEVFAGKAVEIVAAHPSVGMRKTIRHFSAVNEFLDIHPHGADRVRGGRAVNAYFVHAKS